MAANDTTTTTTDTNDTPTQFDDDTKQAVANAMSSALNWDAGTVPATEVLQALDSAGYKLTKGSAKK